MKKYGKYERKPKATSVLLQTYFTSLLSLVLCMVMFFGTSFAWFTSEVNNTSNEIYIGILDVELDKLNKQATGEADKWLSLSEIHENQSDNKYRLFNSDIRWEPGYTMMETIRVTNEGDLAFNYVLKFIDEAAISADTQSAEGTENTEIPADVAACFDVWVYDHQKNNGAPNPGSYTDITADGTKWVNAGSLDELLAGEAVLTGAMDVDDVRHRATDPTETTFETNPGTTDGIDTAHTYTIALHMKEESGSAAMGRKISLTVKLIAYQRTAEKDAFYSEENKQYYEDMVVVTTENELDTAFENGGNIVLAGHIKLTEGLTVASGKTVTLDLNGYSISMETENTNYMITNNGTLTVYDNGSGGKILLYGTSTTVAAIRNSGSLTINGGTIAVNGTSNACSIHMIRDNSATADAVKSTVIINGGNVGTVRMDSDTVTKVAVDFDGNVNVVRNDNGVTIEPNEENGYKVYSYSNN